MVTISDDERAGQDTAGGAGAPPPGAGGGGDPLSDDPIPEVHQEGPRKESRPANQHREEAAIILSDCVAAGAIVG
eukprot:11226707-Lingulodinium_polyedra.AAC.1